MAANNSKRTFFDTPSYRTLSQLDKYKNSPKDNQSNRCLYPNMTHFDGYRTVSDPQGKFPKKCFALCNKVRERPIALEKLPPRE